MDNEGVPYSFYDALRKAEQEEAERELIKQTKYREDQATLARYYTPGPSLSGLVSFEQLWCCRTCFGLVEKRSTKAHTEWHIHLF